MLVYARSTPAHAGNTFSTIALRSRARVYPRPRGEYENQSALIRNSSGLPPPTRGIRGLSAGQVKRTRSTPAHAGNT